MITVMVYSPMLRSPLARGVPRLGREGREIVAPPLQISSLPKIKRERVVRVETLCACDRDEICRSSVVSCGCGPTLDCPLGISFLSSSHLM